MVLLLGSSGKDDKFIFFKNKNVFLTGHTGFKGSWMSHILKEAGANLTGYALEPPTNPSLFEIANIEKSMTSITGDIRDRNSLMKAFKKAEPEIVIHMAAQPLVRDSYDDPVYTYETNVMGTVNILECVRLSTTVKSFLNVTTDKVYENKEWDWGYREIDPLDGFDPYSNSKSCSELVTHSYKKSFFGDNRVRISTARAGNVIGGGDYAQDRIIPDCIRAAEKGKIIGIRNPYSTRPYQHVLEPLFAYLMIIQKQVEDLAYSDYYNVGPDDRDCVDTGTLATLFCNSWGGNAAWESNWEEGPHEANFLKLDCSKLKTKFQWQPRWSVKQAVDKTVEWTKAEMKQENIQIIMNTQIQDYIGGE